MADVSGFHVDTPAPYDTSYTSVIVPFEANIFTQTIPVTYTMRARDANAVGLTYREWKAPIADYSATYYTGTFSGVSKNFVEVAVTNYVEDVTR